MRAAATNIEKKIEEALLSEYQKYYRLAYSYVRNEQDALDIVQESAYKAVKDCKKIEDSSFISTWIYRIVVNSAIDFLRKRRREKGYGEEDEPVFYETGYQESELFEVLKNLKEKDKAIVILRYFQDLKLEEIAVIMDENINTIKARLYRALKKLKLDLDLDVTHGD